MDEKILQLKEVISFFEDLGCYGVRFNNHFDQKIDLQMDAEELVELPFYSTKKISVEDDRAGEYPIRVAIENQGVIFFLIMNEETFVENFPELVEEHEDYIEIKGVRYVRV